MKAASLTHKLLRVVSVIVVSLLLLAGTAVIVPKLLSYDCYAVATGSMGDTLPVGTLIYTKPVAFEDIAVGDVACFYDPEVGAAFTHRVVSVDADNMTMRTEGDGNGIEDPASTPYSYLRGRVVFHLPLLGFLTMILKSKLSLAFVAVVLLGFVIAEIVLTRKERRVICEKCAKEE